MVKKSVTISKPVTVGDKVYDTFTFDVFRTKHFKHMPDELYEVFVDQQEANKEGSTEEQSRENKIQSMKLGFKMIPLVASICNVPEEVIDELEIEDMMKVMGAFNDFLAESSLLSDGKK